jgi:hypothetical protein
MARSWMAIALSRTGTISLTDATGVPSGRAPRSAMLRICAQVSLSATGRRPATWQHALPMLDELLHPNADAVRAKLQAQ